MLLGLEYNPVVGEVLPTLNYTVPIGHGKIVTFGTSSDRIFSPDGTRSYFGTYGWSIEGTRIAPYVSLNYSEWERGWTVPFGVNVGLSPEWDAMVQNDGRNTHWLVNYKQSNWNASLLLVKGRSFGVSYGYRF